MTANLVIIAVCVLWYALDLYTGREKVRDW